MMLLQDEWLIQYEMLRMGINMMVSSGAYLPVCVFPKGCPSTPFVFTSVLGTSEASVGAVVCP